MPEDILQETFKGLIQQTIYTTELDLSRQVLDDLEHAAKVYGLKRSQVADAILKAAFSQYGWIIDEHEKQLSREEE